MKPVLAIIAAIAACTATLAHAADWQPKVKTVHYAISGSTGPALYASIGEKGPVIGEGRRTIAHTTWDLKWRRDYRPTATGCTLASALPLVTITYTLPKPAVKLPLAVKSKWDAFAAGIVQHEQVHGRLVVALANRIRNDTVGLTVENDRDCKKIRDEVIARVTTAFEDYKAENAAFERREMQPGGNVHNLVLALVNG